MNIFYAHQGQFWLDNQPQLLQAAEFHYFRAAKTDWEHRLGLIKEAGFDAVATYIPWRWHQPDDITFDFTGYSHPLRDLAGFLELASQMDLWIIARPGPYIMAETTYEGIPDWLFSKYPQVQLIDQQQKVHPLASYNHPDFLSCVSNWYKEVFKVLVPQQITRGGKIIMVQLDNEMGMPHWVRNVFDTNMDTMNKFAEYIEHLEPHNLQASADFLQHHLRHPQESLGVIISEYYQRFYRRYLADYTIFLLNEAKASGMDVLPVVNIHGYANGAKTFPIGLSQLLTAIKIPSIISATDVYPLSISEGNIHQILLANEMTRALQNPDQPLFSIEFQAGGNLDFGSGQSSLYDLHTRLCVSQGMRAFNHYLFFDGENHPDLSPVKRHDWGHPVRKDGSLRTHYHRYAKLSKVFKAYGQDLILSRPQTITSIGFVLDYFMTEVHNVTTQKKTTLLTQQRETIMFDFIARGLTLTYRPFKAIDLDQGELSTPHCWVMIDRQCSATIQQKLLHYALEGGNLILVGRLCLEDAEGQPCTILRDALGITVKTSSAKQCQIFNHRDVPAFCLETYQGEVGQVFATQQNQTLGFIKNLGKGKVMLLGATLTANTLDDLDIFNQMALEMNCAPLFDCSPWVDVRLSQSEKGDFLFVNNYLDDAVCTTINCQGQTLFGGSSLYLPARSGQILPLEWQLRDTLTLHYITSEITEILEDASSLTIKTALQDFIAELTLNHHHCPEAVKLKTLDHGNRVMVKGTNHTLRLEKV
jgi:beta-galactosidase